MSAPRPSRDPIAESLARAKSDQVWMSVMLVVAACAHAAVVSVLPRRAAASLAPRYGPVEVLVASVPPPPEPVTSSAEHAPEPPSLRPPPSVVRRAAPTTATRSQASAVLTRATSPSDVVDLTDGFVSGSSSTVTGGAAESQGGAPPGPIAASPAPPKSAASVAPTPDRSRKPALAGGLSWACPFPPEADTAGIDEAVVGIRVEVDPSGEVQDVSVPKDPGHGFGRAAQRCARAKRWSPALDRGGNAVAGTVDLRVRFVR